MDKLEYNLVSGSSYLTQHSKNPARDGAILYANMTAIARRLFGAYTDDDMEIVIDAVSGGVIPAAYRSNCNIEQAAKAIDASAKRGGGRGNTHRRGDHEIL